MPEVEVLAHELAIRLDPDQHRLVAKDQITVQVLFFNIQQLTFSLHPGLHVRRVHEVIGDSTRPLPFTLEPKRGRQEAAPRQITVKLKRARMRGEVFVLELAYEGNIDDPPRASRHLRFVRPSETAGHIGAEGVYLSGESYWYPSLPISRPRFQVRVTTPEGWEAVTHGKEVSRSAQRGFLTVQWDVEARTEALTLAANRFQIARRTWEDVEVLTYLFKEDAHLADEYLDAATRYLKAYSGLLGPYPFPKFAVVENFFPSGLGIPSFTLLGSGTIKRRYVQPYSLGHEIVHSWIGSLVLNDQEQGNWVEGLTTYLANYYFHELTGKLEAARKERRMMLIGYAVYVRPEEDYPVVAFQSKRDQLDNAIGYQKSAMVFHMLRREIGDRAFWTGLRSLVARYADRYAEWADLRAVFEDSSGQDLKWFFTQWVEQPGAPDLRIAATYRLKKSPAATGGERAYVVTGRVTQEGTPYQLRLPVRVTMGEAEVHKTTVSLDAPGQTFAITVPNRPTSLAIDPDFEIFRRLARVDLPPMLNLFVTDRARSVALPGVIADPQSPYKHIAARLAGERRSSGSTRKPQTVEVSDAEAFKAPGSVLVLGGPAQNLAAGWAVSGCGNRVTLGADSVTIKGRRYAGSDLALLVTCPHPERASSVVSSFYGASPQATAKVARLLFFYGWESYLVFRNGKVVARGDFPPARGELEVRFPVP
ncbi:MAG: M1 family metallopeptidase [Nitrospiraceae bacterium]